MKLWRASPHTLAQALVIGVVALLALASLIRSLPAFLRPLEAVDFVAYYLAANLLERAEPLYISEYMQAAADRAGVVFLTVYLYPPLFAGLLRPLAALDFQTAARIWVLVNVALMIVGTVFLVRAARLPRWSLPLALLAAFSVPAVITTLLVGQVNIVVFALISAAVYAAVLASEAPMLRQQHRYDALTGAFLGLAAMVKVFPAAFGVVFLLHRRWAALAGMIASVLLSLLLGLLVAGGVPNTTRWFTDVLFRIGMVNQDNLPIMQGPRNVFGRLFESYTYTYDFMVVGNSQQQTFPALIEAPALGSIVATLVSGLIFAITMFWLIRRARQRQPLAADLVLVTAMLMLITPVLWDYYYVLWLIPLAWLVRSYGQLPLYARWLVLLGCLLIVLHRYWRLLVQFASSPLLLALGFAGSVCLWVAVLILADPHRNLSPRREKFV